MGKITERADKFVARLLEARDHPPAEREQLRQTVEDAVRAVQSRLRKHRQAVRRLSAGRK